MECPAFIFLGSKAPRLSSMTLWSLELRRGRNLRGFELWEETDGEWRWWWWGVRGMRHWVWFGFSPSLFSLTIYSSRQTWPAFRLIRIQGWVRLWEAMETGLPMWSLISLPAILRSWSCMERDIGLTHWIAFSLVSSLVFRDLGTLFTFYHPLSDYSDPMFKCMRGVCMCMCVEFFRAQISLGCSGFVTQAAHSQSCHPSF